MAILVLNCGSSTIKFRVFTFGILKPMISGKVEGIGTQETLLFYTFLPILDREGNVDESLGARPFDMLSLRGGTLDRLSRKK